MEKLLHEEGDVYRTLSKTDLHQSLFRIRFFVFYYFVSLVRGLHLCLHIHLRERKCPTVKSGVEEKRPGKPREKGNKKIS